MSETTRTIFAKALINLDTNKAVIGWKEDTFSSIDLVSGKELVFTESELTAEIARLQTEYDAQEYARARQPLYPAIGDQLDDLYHKGAFSSEMTATLKKVKDDNPK